jgi:hypothetical protein
MVSRTVADLTLPDYGGVARYLPQPNETIYADLRQASSQSS